MLDQPFRVELALRRIEQEIRCGLHRDMAREPATAFAVIELAGDVGGTIDDGIASSGQHQEPVLVCLGSIEVLALAERLDLHAVFCTARELYVSKCGRGANVTVSRANVIESSQPP